MSGAVPNLPSSKDGMSQATSQEQRRFRRFGVKLACRVRPRASRGNAAVPELEGETQDVSRGGLFFLASAAWNVGTAIDFELELPRHVMRRPTSIRCRGTITRVVPQEEGRVGMAATIDHYRISSFKKASRR